MFNTYRRVVADTKLDVLILLLKLRENTSAVSRLSVFPKQ